MPVLDHELPNRINTIPERGDGYIENDLFPLMLGINRTQRTQVDSIRTQKDSNDSSGLKLRLSCNFVKLPQIGVNWGRGDGYIENDPYGYIENDLPWVHRN
jgi:hypothetical protein